MLQSDILFIALNIVVRCISSFYMIIPDCDETFNYWEPLSLLIRGFGKQTWEYSPEFAIRSYSYLLPYYVLTYPFDYLVNLFQFPAYWDFYYIRLFLLNGFTIYCEIKLFHSLKRNTNARIAKSYLFLSSMSTGMAHAGVEFLPSSFAMQCVTISLSYALEDVSVESAVASLTWIMIGGLVGWPFSLVLAVPFGMNVVLSHFNKVPAIVLRSLVNLIAILTIIIAVDSIFYKKYVLIPLNIVLYNVFGGEGEGPEIFGVEPLSYYILNLLLNFNIFAILGYLGTIITFKWNKNYFVISMPLIIWSGIFFSQPHKEERFLYPIYSLILVNAAISLDLIFTVTNNIILNITKNTALTAAILRIAYAVVYGLTTTLSLSRTINLVENYSAPLIVPKALASSSSSTNVCIGREWYHFPSSFFLPDNHRLRFIRSGFDGLLPRDFEEGVDFFEATSFIPEDMNNKNVFVDSTVISFEECDYYIDNSGVTNCIEPSVGEDANWEVVVCHKLINPEGDHSGIGRLLYIPKPLRHYIPYNVDYMEYCLFKRQPPV
ncbi:mannosyltransferase [Yamadazyma tenuis]|uniref:Mannosyltransferase n=1 Tax=Candida tenuis (strain ATCC 10573 / BCRC 21748 / CBS 615 / JCM 9827 / NBRC 10315 / NRRL Y-1498 / VKM Y-70) TaxID=590646 RepID=G3B1Q6_CANTC|nr:uncharacterized protein CANTEDRAFT_113273 [Yamadazyma tenuis ATCC 10573]XP_006685808.1 uncharacterized protein CANTEDRAFT_113273 [Yamadazyma tenuis ATCC 10573]EGV65001.1 hypothetical protein CANTEDRAFT_113273 [Yamadazyma tenuis ATCC 10573]EGV65002.1 hypothetical protein CANTEDRAFT_113273 [Yamadazyma tenuis ATCC 10573]WEJ97269.1 mannosyltransferase [Yamadazyma tenuis]